MQNRFAVIAFGLLAIFVNVWSVPTASAQTPGSLDTSFGGVGFVSTAVKRRG